MDGSWLSASMRASRSASLRFDSYFSNTERMPVSAQALTLLRTYTAEAGSSPTRMTARPGWRPLALRLAARVAMSVRSWRERALPSMSCAVMGWAGDRR